MIEQTLHGLVVGLGKIRKDGSKEFRWLDKPIHNRIVSGGLDAYFMYDGSPTNTNSNYNAPYFANRFITTNYQRDMYGLLQYIAIGTDGTATSFLDTTLKSQVGGYSNSFSYNAVPYYGTRLNNDNSISVRVPRTSVAVESATTVREIGWFEKYTNSDTYVMFSRVVLPSPVELNAGEQLTVVYQLNISLGNLEETEVPQSLLSGLLDSDGNQLRGSASYRLYFSSNSSSGSPPAKGSWYNSYNSLWGTFFGIGYYYEYYTQGPKIISCNLTAGYGYETVSPFDTYASNIGRQLSYTLNSNFNIVAQCGYMANGRGEQVWKDRYLTNSNSTSITSTVKSYELGSHQRDREIVVAPAWPSMTTEQYQDIYAICHNSYLIRFGYMDTTDPSNPVWVPKPWRKQFGQSYKFTFRYKLSTADTVE